MLMATPYTNFNKIKKVKKAKTPTAPHVRMTCSPCYIFVYLLSTLKGMFIQNLREHFYGAKFPSNPIHHFLDIKDC